MQINIVCGLPGAGKSTYVQRHLGEHDLVYDYDVDCHHVIVTQKYTITSCRTLI